MNFVYRGKRRKRLFGNGPYIDRAFSYFMDRMVGNNLQVVTRGKWFHRLGYYLNDLYPEFLSKNPFEDPEYFAFPFKNVTLDHMHLVYQMEHRLELLKIAEEREMSFLQFLNYVVNHIYSYNEEHKKPKYQLMHYGVVHEPPYISSKGFSFSSGWSLKTPGRFVHKAHG